MRRNDVGREGPGSWIEKKNDVGREGPAIGIILVEINIHMKWLE